MILQTIFCLSSCALHFMSAQWAETKGCVSSTLFDGEPQITRVKGPSLTFDITFDFRDRGQV